MLPRPTLDDVTRRSNTIAGAKPSDWTCWGNVLESHPAASPAQPGQFSPSGRQPVPYRPSPRWSPSAAAELRLFPLSDLDQALRDRSSAIDMHYCPYGRGARLLPAAGFHVQLLGHQHQEIFDFC